MSAITFEEIMVTILSATQDVMKMYMNADVLAGKMQTGVETIKSDIVGIIGVGGDRVGYVLFSASIPTAKRIAKDMLMIEEPTDSDMRDAVGEITNNIAGLFKNKFQEEYGSVALGLPLVVSGTVRPPQGTQREEPAQSGQMKLQVKGVTIPFLSQDGSITFKVMVLI